MPRCARLLIPGLPLHVMQRGHNKQACFLEEPDYRLYLALLGELANRQGCDIHAYVLMTNHVHLLLTSREPRSISTLMKHVNQRFVQFMNRKYARTGSLWEGRFRSNLVDSESYLLRCQRYIELNPVRAHMVRHPDEYPWSSYPANANGTSSGLVTPHPQFAALGRDDDERRAFYRSFAGEAPESDELEAIREAANSGMALGREEFVAAIESQLGVSAAKRKPGPRAGRA